MFNNISLITSDIVISCIVTRVMAGTLMEGRGGGGGGCIFIYIFMF